MNRSKAYYRSHQNKFHFLIIGLVILGVYYKVYFFEFLIGWDDQWFVTNDYTTNGFSLYNLNAILTEFYRGQYAPINQLYYTALYHFFGYNASYFHVFSVIIHFFNACLVYVLCKKLIPLLVQSDIYKYNLSSVFSALLFAILPINIEPVAWVAASKVLIYGFFYLSALYSYCLYIDSRQPKYFYLTILLFILSFGAKEQAITLPLCLLLLDYLYVRSFKTKVIWFEKLPIFILALLFGLVTVESQELENARNLNFYPFDERVVLVSYTITEYFTKILFPTNLSFIYPFPYLVGEALPKWLWIHFLGTICVFVLAYRKIQRWLAFGTLFFITHIMLVVNLFSLSRFSIVADRYGYISSIGLTFLVSYLIVFKLATIVKPMKVWLPTLLYVGLLITYTHHHIEVWRNVKNLKYKVRNVIKGRPDYNKINILKR